MQSGSYPYLPISAWWQEPIRIQPKLETDESCDVVVIGGGYTGLSTAIALKDAGYHVILLEQGVCGSGSSGRNAGHLTPTIGKDIPSLLKVYGREKAGKLLRFAEDAVEHVESFITSNGIDCDYHSGGNIIAAVHQSQVKALRISAKTAVSLGCRTRFLEPEDMRSRGVPESFLCGVDEETGGVLNPGKLIRGLRSLALNKGVAIFENSPVVGFDEGAEIKARCPHGQVSARHAVIAVNAYLPALGLGKIGMKRKLAPVVVTLLETEPLEDHQVKELKWPGREGIYTAHEILESYHLTVRNTIVAGSKQILIPYGSRLPSTRQEKLFAQTTAAFQARFPQLSQLAVRSYWGGYIAISLDFLPLAGCTGKHGNIHYGLAYAGHGVAQAVYMGEMLKGSITGEGHPALELLRRRSFSWPPEPIRWTVGQLLRKTLTLMDKRVDRKVLKSQTGR